MQGNDIGITYVARYAVKFEGLLMHRKEVPEEKKGFFERLKVKDSDKAITRESKLWKPNDMPMKSLLHLVNQLKMQVQVVTYMGEWYEEEIEEWLARKGAFVDVVSYDDAWEWAEDLRRNTEIKGYYTDDPQERDTIGWQHVTVVRPTQTWGI